MLTSLIIKNFVIVQHLELDFAQGMTAFTGETGAGKSIMIDALMLALGGRGDTSMIRTGSEQCDISAIFHIDTLSESAQWLNEHDLNFKDGEVILRRVLFAEGRSKSYINGQPFPLQKVKTLSEMLVHIHGQHQHQTLLHHQTHRQQLDNFAKHPQLLAATQHSYKECQKIKQELDSLLQHTNQKDKQKLLQFQIEELQGLGLHEDEMQSLHKEHQLLHHAQDYLQHSQQIADLLQDNDELTVCQMLNQVLHLLQQLPQEHPIINSLKELIQSTIIQSEEAADEIHHFSEQVQLDPERLHQVENRLSALHLAARKYHVDASQLPSYLNQLQDEFNGLQQSETRIKQLNAMYQQQTNAFEQAAKQLTTSRETAAKKLCHEITKIIQKLGIPHGFVEMDISPLDKMQPYGLDRVEYKVCTNPGSLPDDLAKIASGGELSRISLAIQMVTAQRATTPTLLFDEVDVGIGGATAALVGQLLRKLGERLQVFCVTHQPQVAACANHHFVVEKHSHHDQTFSQIIALEQSEKIDEIARMLGGLTITEQSRLHAKELLELENISEA